MIAAGCFGAAFALVRDAHDAAALDQDQGHPLPFTIVHANAHHMATVIENTSEAIARIKAPVLGNYGGDDKGPAPDDVRAACAA